MWRPAHGATSRPGCCRPASGYGRALGRPGPSASGSAVTDACEGTLDPATFVELAGLTESVEQEAEAPAPVTP